LERVRRWYGFYVTGYVVMPEHVHLLISEPERGKLSTALQMLKQITAQQLGRPEGAPFWQPRYYDFNVWSEAKRVQKLRYIHRNPVKRDWWIVRKTGGGAVFATMPPELRVLSNLSPSERHDSASGRECR
jgi:REP element-mobilizing transposase RayT